MGTGTDVAMESAGVTLLKGDLTGIVRARRLSQATMSNIRQNLFFAFIYNAARRAGRGRRALPVLRHPAVADHRRRRHGAVVGQRDRQCPATEDRSPLALGQWSRWPVGERVTLVRPLMSAGCCTAEQSRLPRSNT